MAPAGRFQRAAVVLVWMMAAAASQNSIPPTLDQKDDLEAARDFASQCLAKASPGTSAPRLAYPADAPAHFQALHEAHAELLQRPEFERLDRSWGGVEAEAWTPEFLRQVASQRFPDQDAAELGMEQIFGPYIPLFFKWTAIHRARPNVGQRDHADRYPAVFLRFLHEHLRPDVLYITAVQSDLGIAGRCEISHAQFPNVVVLSSGGYGHIPIPLFPKPGSAMSTALNTVPVGERMFLVSYVGSAQHSPRRTRPLMIEAVANASKALGFKAVPHYKGHEWKRIMAHSRVSLAPRGFGRTAYHLLECIQAGLLPLHVYSDVPWVPYQSLFEKGMGFVARVDQLEALLQRIHAMKIEVVRRREAKLLAIHEALFTPHAVAVQMLRLMLGQHHQLECGPLPPTIRDAEDMAAPENDFDGAAQYYPMECA